MSVNLTGIIQATFSGRSSAGAISAPGLEVGDILLWLGNAVEGVVEPYHGGGLYEPVVSVADEIQQLSATDFSGQSWKAILFRGTWS